MTRDERWYRLALRAYPARFRESYEREMVLLFRDQRRDGATQNPSYWASLFIDIARTAPGEWRDHVHSYVQRGGVLMKGMAIIAVLVAAFEMFNAAAELFAGGVTGRSGGELLAIAIAVAGPALLLVAGVDLLRRGRAAASFGIGAAVVCMASFAFVGATHPMLSGVAMLMGIGVPMALLVFLLVNRGSGSPKAA